MFFKYLIAAVQLVPQAYSDIAADRRVLKQALFLSILSSTATGIGNSGGYPERIPLAAAFAFIAWVVWVSFIYILGTKVLREPEARTELGALFRIAGFASVPGLIRLLAYLPPFAGIASVGAMLWMLAMMVLGVKQTFGYQHMPRAIAVTLISWPLYQWVLSQG